MSGCIYLKWHGRHYVMCEVSYVEISKYAIHTVSVARRNGRSATQPQPPRALICRPPSLICRQSDAAIELCGDGPLGQYGPLEDDGLER